MKEASGCVRTERVKKCSYFILASGGGGDVDDDNDDNISNGVRPL